MWRMRERGMEDERERWRMIESKDEGIEREGWRIRERARMRG